VLPFTCHSQTKCQSWSHRSLSISFCFSHIRNQFITNLLYRWKWYFRCCLSSSFYNLLKFLILEVSVDFTFCEIVDRILYVAIKVDNCHNSIGSFCTYSIDVVRYSYLYNFFSRNILKVFLFFMFRRFHPSLLFSCQLFFEWIGYISYGFTWVH